MGKDWSGKGSVPPPLFPLRKPGDTDIRESGDDASSGVEDGVKSESER